MNIDSNTLIVLAGFILLVLASKQVGQFLTRFKFPLISGFLLAGILVGPYGLGFIETADITFDKLDIIEQILHILRTTGCKIVNHLNRVPL